MADWCEVLRAMPDNEWVARPAHPNTMNAILKRGLVERDGNMWRRCKGVSAYLALMTAFTYKEFAVIKYDNQRLGMLCSKDGNDVLDCWGNTLLDFSHINCVEFYTDGKRHFRNI